MHLTWFYGAAPRHHHSTPLLEKLHWLPISELIKYKVACMCFSVINGSGPAYLSELLLIYTPPHTLRSSSDDRMLKIQQHKICQTVYFKLKHISSICRFLTEDAAKTLVTSCVLSRLDYFNSWVHLTLSSNLSNKFKTLLQDEFSWHPATTTEPVSYTHLTLPTTLEV